MKKSFSILAFILTISVLNSQNKTPETVFVEGGTFKMGIDESKYLDEFPHHYVSLNDFYIGKYEVTIEEYTGFCRTAGLDLPKGELDIPATGVSWEEAIMYCNWLSRLNRLNKYYTIIRDDKKKIFKVKFDKTANGYRLPTEAEWEYAARGGVNLRNHAYSGSNTAYEVAWYSDTGKMLQSGGKKKPNELGLYDMSGNCQEWCYDIYSQDFYKISPKENPVCEEGTVERVSRGGNFSGHEATLRITKRFYNKADFKYETLGFRVAKNK